MTARQRRLTADYEQVKKDFAGHKNIIVTPVGALPPERYHVTYFVNGIYLQPDGKIETLGRHEVDITLHAEYPRFKPVCTISTPIWHPNFRDGQICIGDIWGAGESLTDIIINIGDMIQYKSWNSSSPLSADAAKWALENRHLFPVGNIDLYIADYASAKDTVEIDLFDAADAADAPEAMQAEEPAGEPAGESVTVSVFAPAPASVPQQNAEPFAPVNAPAPGMNGAPFAPQPPAPPQPDPFANDFEITAEELAGVTFVPTAQRMQALGANGMVKTGKISLKTVLVKGLLWALIGVILGFGVTELTGISSYRGQQIAASVLGHSHLAKYFEYSGKRSAEFKKVYDAFTAYCKENDIDPEEDDAFMNWYMDGGMSDSVEKHMEKSSEYSDKANEEIFKSYDKEFNDDEDLLESAIKRCVRIGTGIWSGLIALFLGLALGVGEGIYYGSAENAVKYGAIGAAVSLILGFFSGDLAQLMYAELMDSDAELLMQSLVRGAGWAIMGLGVGLAVGLTKPTLKRILFCSLGGAFGAFAGGFLFNYIAKWIPKDFLARGVAFLIMGLLIGLGVGLLEQFAKAAWLKVIRGEFEGKEYLVFAGTTSIGNTGKNNIVLFKDKLVGPHHCDIKLEGGKYVLSDCGTPMGTVVNGARITRHVLRPGDTIAIGNSVLVFNTKK